MDTDTLNKLMNIYTKAINLARTNNQVVGEENDYYITLQQLEAFLLEEPRE